MTTFHVITLFPEALTSYVSASIIGRAIKEKKIKIKTYNPRDFASRPKSKTNKDWFYRQVDARPYGGGAGMVLMAEPILRAVKRVKSKIKNQKSKVIILSPGGEQFSNKLAARWSKSCHHLVLIAGRYEGIDARVKKILKAEDVSIGPYILTGGELPALAVIDAVARQLPGVLGKDESVEERRTASAQVYTRPETLKYGGKHYRVPKVLLSGDHKKIENWRLNR